MSDKPVLISACLMGIATRYDGTCSFSEEAVAEAGSLPLPICPEQLGGLPTPRKAALIEGGSEEDVIEGRARVINADGEDVTSFFIRGAEAVLEIARRSGAETALLKERSPSCGVNFLCRGARQCPGTGVTTALLRKNGIKVKGF